MKTAILILRRNILRAGAGGGLGLAAGILAARTGQGAAAPADDAESALLAQLTGGAPVLSPRVRLDMPAAFGNGYSVPLALAVDSPMDEQDHVRRITVIAPRNPIVLVAKFEFTPQSGCAAIATRVRLSEPQTVIAVAEMSDGALLMARTWVKVETNGCA